MTPTHLLFAGIITAALLLLRSVTAMPATSHQLAANPEHLIWDAWPMSDRHQHDHKPKKITPKSIFITPNFNNEAAYNCPPDHKLDNNGRCIQIVKINHDELLAHRIEALLSQTTNTQNTESGDYDYDYEMEPGPYQISLPLSFEAYPASQQALPLTGALDAPTNSFRPSTGERNGEESGSNGTGGEGGKNSYYSPSKTAQDNGPDVTGGSGGASAAPSSAGSNQDGSNGTPPPSQTTSSEAATLLDSFPASGSDADQTGTGSTSGTTSGEFGTYITSSTATSTNDNQQPSTTNDNPAEGGSNGSVLPSSGIGSATSNSNSTTSSTESVVQSDPESSSDGELTPELSAGDLLPQSTTVTSTVQGSPDKLEDDEDDLGAVEEEFDGSDQAEQEYGDDSRVVYETVNSTIEEPHFTGNQTELLMLEQAIDMTNNTGEMEFIDEDESYEDIGASIDDREALFFGAKTSTTSATTPAVTTSAVTMLEGMTEPTQETTTETTTAVPYYDRISTETSVVTATASEGPVFIVTPEPTKVWHPSLFSSPGGDNTRRQEVHSTPFRGASMESSTEPPLIIPEVVEVSSETPELSSESSVRVEISSDNFEAQSGRFETSSEAPEVLLSAFGAASSESPQSDRLFVRQPALPPQFSGQMLNHNQETVLKHERTQDYLDNLDSNNRFVYHHLTTQRVPPTTAPTTPSTTTTSTTPISILEQIKQINRIVAENRLRHPNYPPPTRSPPTRFRFPSQSQGQSFEAPVVFPGANSNTRFAPSYPWQRPVVQTPPPPVTSRPTTNSGTTQERPLWWLPNVRYDNNGNGGSGTGGIAGGGSSQLLRLWERMPLVRDPSIVRERSNSRSTRRENSRSPSENLYRELSSTQDVYRVLQSAERDWKHTNS